MTDLGSIATAAFQRAFERDPEFVVRAPGRVNLLGEHVDYNEGFVLPIAIDRAAYLAVGAADTGEAHIHAHDIQEDVVFRTSRRMSSFEHRRSISRPMSRAGR